MPEKLGSGENWSDFDYPAEKSKMLGHSPRSASKLAHIYITEDWDVVDQANRLVIDCIFSNRVNTIIKNTIQTQQITLIAPNNPSSTLGQRLIASR